MPRRCLSIILGCTIASLLAAASSAAELDPVAGEHELFTREQNATVRIGGCSGVCISPDGYVLSAKHCRHEKRVTVRIGVETFPAEVVAAAATAEGAVLLKMTGGPFAYVPLAESPPTVGEAVHTHGFPLGEYRFYRGGIAKVTGGPFEPAASPGDAFWYTTVDRPMFPGHSGGPLFNDRGEVIGLLSSTDARSSLWIPLAHIRQLVEQVTCRQPIVYAFTRPGCRPCELFKADAQAGRFREFRIEYVTFDSGGWNRPDVLEQMRRKLGETTVSEIQTPTFWVEDGPQVWVGYSSDTRNGLLDWLRAIVGRIANCPLGRATPPPSDPPPEESPNESPERDPIDWSLVRIVALASDETPTALRFVTGPARRALEELTDSRAQLTIVAERTQPERYRAVVEASGAAPAPLYLLVLVEQHDLGLRGVILKPVEQRLREVMTRQEKLPVELIFRRAHPDDFAAVEAALDVPEDDDEPNSGGQIPTYELPQGEPDDDPISWLWGLLAAPLAALKRRYLDRETNR